MKAGFPSTREWTFLHLQNMSKTSKIRGVIFVNEVCTFKIIGQDVMLKSGLHL